MSFAEEAQKFQQAKRIENNNVRRDDNAVAALTVLRDELRKYLAGKAPLHAEHMLRTAQAGLA